MAFQKLEISDHFYCLEQRLGDGGLVRCFLFIGTDKALLIDAGIRDPELKSIVETITSLPVTVVFTHADGDHVGNADQFEHRLMHPSEFDYYERRNQNIVPMNELWEDDVIDIGTFRFEIILIPGHTPGGIALLEREKRFLIAGDTLQEKGVFMFGEGRNFNAFQASMRKLQKRKNDFDTIYASHNDLNLSPEVIDRLLIGVKKISEESVPFHEAEHFGESMKLYETSGVVFILK